MSPRAAAALAWSVLGVFAVLQVLTLWLIWSGPATGDQAFGVLMAGYATVGALVAARRPHNTVGWLLLATAVSFAVQSLAEAYAWSPSYPGYLLFAWLAAWVWCVPVMLAGIFLPLVFPDGRLLSPRWRPVVWLGAVALTAAVAGQVVKPGGMGLEAPGAPPNPLGAPEEAAGLIDAQLGVAYTLGAIACLLAVVSLVLRFRRARGAARQQLKWLALVGLVALAAVAVGVFGTFLPAGTWRDGSDAATYVILLIIFVLGIPAATGIAVLRHRLYDIDLVINRTLVYVSLTAVLVGTYLGSVLTAPARAQPGDRALGPRGGRVDAGGRCAGATPPVAHPENRRPSVLPRPLRRRPHARGLLRPATGRDRPRDPRHRSAPRGARHGAAQARVAVAAGRRTMSRRTAAWLAWSLFGLFVGCLAATLGFIVLDDRPAGYLAALLALGFAAVGALVAAREPANAVGWILLVAALAYAFPAEAYARNADHPGSVVGAWMAGWLWFLWFGGVALLLPLLFPTGRLLSRRWRVALTVAATAIVLDIVTVALTNGDLDISTREPVANPLGVTGPLAGVVTVVGFAGGVLTLTALVLGPLSLVLRLRRSRGRERQQLKVFAYVVVAIAAMALFVVIGWAVRPLAPRLGSGFENFGWLVGLLLVILGVPFAVGIAILRHHLYGIDVVINRTLVYAGLTVILGASYLAAVLVLRLVLSPVTGESDLAVAGSTLAVAALFRPARTRMQSLVDRRFYRARYDATQTLEAFGARLRHEVDLESLGKDLRAVVNVTVQPSLVSLWLRDEP